MVSKSIRDKDADARQTLDTIFPQTWRPLPALRGASGGHSQALSQESQLGLGLRGNPLQDNIISESSFHFLVNT